MGYLQHQMTLRTRVKAWATYNIKWHLGHLSKHRLPSKSSQSNYGIKLHLERLSRQSIHLYFFNDTKKWKKKAYIWLRLWIWRECSTQWMSMALTHFNTRYFLKVGFTVRLVTVQPVDMVQIYNRDVKYISDSRHMLLCLLCYCVLLSMLLSVCCPCYSMCYCVLLSVCCPFYSVSSNIYW